MTNLTATQVQLLADATDAALVRQAYVMRGLASVDRRTDHALCNAVIAAQDLALTAGVPQSLIDQGMHEAEAEAMRVIWG